MQLDMFDKPIAELRVVQVVNSETGAALNWSLEFRFASEDRWNPVKIQVYSVEVKENVDESGTGSQEAS